jgi:hypothetical protein
MKTSAQKLNRRLKNTTATARILALIGEKSLRNDTKPPY